MISSLLADLVLLMHGAFIAFAVLGALFAFRWVWAPAAHLPALVWAAYIEFTGGICPLTTLENFLRHSAGEVGYSTSFIQHYLTPVIYPPGLAPARQVWLAVVLLGFNALLYGLVVERRGWFTRKAA